MHDGSEWRDEAIRRLQDSLRSVTAPADRCALLREWSRLAGRSIPLVDGNLRDLTPAFLRRFGLTVDEGSGRRLRILEPVPAEAELPAALREQLLAALPVDPRPRRAHRGAPPDGALLRLSAHAEYRNEAQKAAGRAVLTMLPGGTLVTSLSTGTGKSLLFQMAVRFWRESASAEDQPVALVVVPTVALALDHVETIARECPDLGASAALHGALSSQDRDSTIEAFRQGSAPLLFAGPEIALGPSGTMLRSAAAPRLERPTAARGRLAAIFIDEAHIVATWGQTFRPEFQRLPGLIRELRAINPGLRVVLLSATLDCETRAHLRGWFSDSGDYLEVVEGTPRTEFDIVVHQFPDAVAREHALPGLVDLLPRPSIVYTTRVDAADDLGSTLRSRGYERLAVFTGGTGAEERRRIVEAWRAGRLDLVVATSAFGMGVNHPHVRSILHACLPEGGDRYYQEVGRAARDGHQALAVLAFCPEDEDVASGVGGPKVLTEDTAWQRWSRLVELRSSLGSDAAGLRARFPLSAATLDNEHPGNLNRNWNRALLVQLQRYGALIVDSNSDLADEWEVTFQSGHAALVDGGPHARDLFSKVFAQRDKELRFSAARVATFLRLARRMGQSNPCFWASVFGAVEESRGPLPCGRCPSCRAQGTVPPVSARGPLGLAPAPRQQPWPAQVPPVRPMVLNLQSGGRAAPTEAIQLLAQHGVQQFLVPREVAAECAQALVAVKGNPGLVLTIESVLDRGVLPACVRTAVIFLPRVGRQIASRAFELLAHDGELGFAHVAWWVAEPTQEVGDRTLRQIGSAHTAVDLDWLSQLEEPRS